MLLASEISVKHREKHNLSLGDCYCLALGKYLDLLIFTADKLWVALDVKIGVQIKFIR